MSDVFDQLREIVEAAGFFTTRHGKDDLTFVCASRKDTDGSLSGNSFTFEEFGDSWIIETWAPRSYLLPKCVSVEILGNLFIELLAGRPGKPHMARADFPGTIVKKYNLIPLPQAEQEKRY